MSRIGKQPIDLPAGVTLTIENKVIKATGPKGSLETPLLGNVSVKVADNVVTVERANDEPLSRARHGLTRALVNNMVVGVSQGFERKLEINGVGFRVVAQGNQLKFSLGYSHEINFTVPEGINVAIDQNVLTITGISKQQVGQVAAEIRALRKPEPYKGKGIKYSDERVLRKSGKSGKE